MVVARDSVLRRTASVRLWDFCNGREIFCARHIAGRIFCSDVTIMQRHGGVRTSIDTLILILILTFAAGFVLNRFDAKRHL